MGILTTTIALLNVLKEYLELKNKKCVFEIVEHFDKTIDSLDEKRKTLRNQNDSESQRLAAELLNEILEEKKKFKLWKDSLKY